MTDLGSLGKNYTLSHLEEKELNASPFKQFDIWFKEALSAGVKEANAMTLATVDKTGQVSVRMMLCKAYDEHGFVFFTNYNSRKGEALLAHPQAAIQFWWPGLERQVRIEGLARKLDAKGSDAYFAVRDKASNVAAILSKQSQVMPDKQSFINEYENLKTQYQDKDGPTRPDHWGGFVLEPTRFEFWQGRPNRLHDRLCYQKPATENKDKNWEIVRLYP